MRSVLWLLLVVSTMAAAAGFCPSPPSFLQPGSLVAPHQRTSRLFQANSVTEMEMNFLERAQQNAGGANRPQTVYTLVYNPFTEDEGVHTVKYPGSGQEIMLAFESMEEAYDFAFALGAEPSVPGQPVATPTPLEQIEKACQQMRMAVAVIPEP